MMTFHKWILSLVSAFSILSYEAQAHFFFADLDSAEQPSQLLVTFSEPGMESHMEFITGDFHEMMVYQPSLEGNVADPSVVQMYETNGYSIGHIDSTILDESRPSFITGYLDYGLFHGANLQYTFSAQTFTETHPEDDWKNYFHNFLPTLGTGIFRIAFRNYGPPYEVVVGGFDDLTIPIQACLFSTNGKNLGCTTDSTAGKNHIMVEATETLRDCEKYFALANATVVDTDGKTTMYWSSTSVFMKGESCESKAAVASGSSTWFVLSFVIIVMIGCFVRMKSKSATASMVAGVDDIEKPRYQDGAAEDDKTIELS